MKARKKSGKDIFSKSVLNYLILSLSLSLFRARAQSVILSTVYANVKEKQARSSESFACDLVRICAREYSRACSCKVEAFFIIGDL